MSMVHHYKSNLRDIFFNLFEANDIASTTLKSAKYEHLDEAMIRQTLEELAKLAETELAASYAASDRNPLLFDKETGDVTLPEALKTAMGHWYDGGWQMLGVPMERGGVGAPPSVGWAATELPLGASPCLVFYDFGVMIAKVIDQTGTQAQRDLYVQRIIDEQWGASMVLTEAGAGSDVGAGRTKARHVEGDVWEIEGVKRFISQADYDVPDNIVHLVLARPEGAGPGTKGLSMFIVPKYWVNDDGTIGERNGAYVTNVEDKMGLKASATCEMTFGERSRCLGRLVGDDHKGISQMFQVIEQARMAIGVKSCSQVSTAYLNALDYAKERVQGPDLMKARDKTAPRVRIIEHPDVRRQLMFQKSYAEGLRALYSYTAYIQDQVEVAGGHGAGEAAQLDALNDLLLPIVKGYSSEHGYEVLSVALQVFGGSGYIRDYPIEQYIRDQKIDTLYEGTTHIQALDLFFRKIARDGGATLRVLLGNVGETVMDDSCGGTLARERDRLGSALDDLQAILGAMMQKVPESLYHVGLHANRILYCLGDVVVSWLLLKHAILAAQKIDGASESDRAFYEGKVASARFFIAEVLPRVATARNIIQAGTLELMDIDEAAF